MFVTRNVMMKYREANNGEGNDLGGDGGAAKAAADAAAAAKVSADAQAAADAAAAKGTKTGPTDEEAKLIREVMDKKTKLKDASDKIAALEATVKQFEGIDVEGVRALLAEKQSDETRKLEEKGQWDSLKKQMVEGHEKEKGTLTAQLTAQLTETELLKKQIGDLTVGNAFNSSTFIKEDMTMPVGKARVLYGTQFEYQDGAVVAFDKPAGKADRAILVDAKGDPLNFEAAIKKIVEGDEDSAQLLKSKIKQGSGSKTVSKAASPNTSLDQPSGKDRIAAALSKGVLNKK